MLRLGSKLVLLSAIILLTGNLTYADTEDDSDGITVENEVEEEVYESPQVDSKNVYFVENFDDPAAFKKKWIVSEAKKQGVDEAIAKYDGKWEVSEPIKRIFKNDLGLVLKTEAKHAAISALLNKPFEFKDKPFVVQYEVTMQEGQNCGGAYIKLLSKGTNAKNDLRNFYDQTPYTIMFGPDKCGHDNKLHFIFRHKNPKNGTIEEKHSQKPSARLDDIYKDKEPHLYTLIVRPDNTFSVLVDNKEFNSGSLLEDFTPPVNPPEEIDDPNDIKPDDWDEREQIVDPTASKPEDWDETAPAQILDPNAVKPDGWLDDEPELIPDAEAVRPSDWDNEIDGWWEPPLVDNPKCKDAPGCGEWKQPTINNPNYKGIWRAPLIPNPNYKGKWLPRKIPNPHFFRDEHPFRMTPISAVGFELWSMSPLLLFDNLIITDDPAVAEELARQTFAKKREKLVRDSKTLWGRILRAVNYKPGYWALYIIYCCIPISIYVGYLVKRGLEKDSVVDRVLLYASANPWVYVVAIIGVFLVVGFFAYLCCGSSKDDLEDPKKTDAVQEDDPQEDSESEPRPKEARSKMDLEGPADEEPDSTEETPEVPPETQAGGDTQRRRKPRKD